MSTEPAGTPVSTPRPSKPPTYAGPPPRVAWYRRWHPEEAVDDLFFVFAAGLVLWLGGLVLAKDLRWSAFAIGYLVVFWLLLAYVGLPRLQEVLARIYVPDYFIGRTVTGDGVLGDPVNLALDGTEADVHAAMLRAGWTLADEVTLRSSWGIIVSAVLRRSYPAAPVSPLFLFGRRQSFAYEQEVDGNAAQRHHVRFWPAPDGWRLQGGARVGWLAGATYDRAVGLSLFTLQVTHKVAADIDVERDYVIATVRYAEPKAELRVIEDFSTAFHARNGGGDLVHTDGDLPVLDVSPLAAIAPSAPPVPVGAAPRPSTWHLAPPGLLASGLMSLAKAGLTLLALLALALGASRHHWLPGVSSGRLVLIGAVAAVVVVLWLLVLARRAWARTALMAVCSVEAVVQLLSLGAADRVSLLVLATTSISVLIVIAVSSTSARQWVFRAV